MAKGQNSAQNAILENSRLRNLLLGSSPRYVKNLGTYTAPVGGTTRIKLYNVGVVTSLRIYVSAAITIGTAIAVPSLKAPFNLINRIRLTDYDGTDRINCSGLQLFALNCKRFGAYYGYNNDAATAVITNPNVPTAIGDATLSFFLDIPLAYDPDNLNPALQDLRGAIMAQTSVGEMTLSIDWNSSLVSNGDIESVYSGAATTTVALQAGQQINCTAYQNYIVPQAIGPNGQVPLPFLDLMTVYEIAGNVRSSDNLAVGTEKQLNYPNVRSVLGAFFNYVQGATMSATDIAQFRLIVNGNNIMLDRTQAAQIFAQRLALNGDMRPGMYFFDHRNRPVETALYGNVQAGITPSTVGANPYIEIMFESMYTKGAALPGVTQN